MSDPSLVRFRAVVEGALAHLESRRQEINDLNVFPVADGDTGDNMALTLRAVLTELDRLAADEDRLIDEIGRDEIVDSVARAALLGARGNSGVILSQLIRGAAEELVSRPGELVDPVLIGAAMARAADRAYGSVREPAEGTILTVMREMAVRDRHRAGAHGRHAPGRRGRPRPSRTRLIADILERAIEAGRGVGAARPRPAAGSARERRRGRRRVRRRRDLRRHRRRAARHRAPGAPAPRAGPGHAIPSTVLDLPLLHELRGHRPRPGIRPLARRRWRSSATRCSSSATPRR